MIVKRAGSMGGGADSDEEDSEEGEREDGAD